jgi:glycosyltransferase involved in cell wall biosynthesis
MHKKAVGIIDYIGVKGGHHYYSLCLLNALEKKGIATYYFSNLEASDFSQTQCVKVFRRDLRRNLSGLWQLFYSTLKSIRFSKKQKVTTQIFHVFEASIINCLVLTLLRLSGFKTIVIVHDIKSFDIKEGSWLRRLQYNMLSNELIVHNQYCHDIFLETFPQLKTPLHIIAHGGHLDVIKSLDKTEARQSLGLSNDKTYFLFFGQIRKSKGLDILLEGFPRGTPAKLIIAGKPWRDSFADYQRIIDRRDLKDSIQPVIRYIEDDEKDLFYSAVDYIVLPYKEIYQSGVLLMSMSYGKAVIASDLPANKEVIKHGKNGLLFSSEDPKDLSGIILKALTTDHNKLGAKALETIQSDFDWNKLTAHYLPLLK